MARKRGWWSFWGKRKKKAAQPKIDHNRPFPEQIKQLQAQINNVPKPKPKFTADEVIISTTDYLKVLRVWLYEPLDRSSKKTLEASTARKTRLAHLLLLYSNENVPALAVSLGITKQKLLESLEELKTLENNDVRT